MQRIILLYHNRSQSIYNYSDYLFKYDFWHQQDWDLQQKDENFQLPLSSQQNPIPCTRDDEEAKLVG